MTLALRVALPLLLSLCTTASVAQGAASKESIVSFPTPRLNWKEIPDTGGVKYANVRSDLAGKGPYEAFVIFPAGKDNPFHHHSQDLPTVVLQGTFYAVVNGQRTEYPAGSFYDLPARFEHFSGCVPGSDCLLFQYQQGPFDLVGRNNP